jgi:hypothetical protein
MITATIIPVTEDALVYELVQVAKAAGMYLISDGFKVVVSPIVPPGFFKIAIRVKNDQFATLEAIPCAA